MIGLKSLLEYFHINTMSVPPLAISSFGTFFMLSFNTVLPVKSLIVILLGFFICILCLCLCLCSCLCFFFCFFFVCTVT